LKPKRVFLEGDIYKVEAELKQFTATVKVDVKTLKLKNTTCNLKAKKVHFHFHLNLLIITVISSVVNVDLYFAFKLIGV